MSALDFGARGMARQASSALRRSGTVTRLLRAARAAEAGNPGINSVQASGGGTVTVTQSGALPGGLTDVGNIANMIASGNLPVRTFGGNPQTPFGTSIRILMPGGGYNPLRFETMVEGTQVCFTLGTGTFRLIADNSYVGSGGLPTTFSTKLSSNGDITFTGALTSATSATLSAAWAGATGTYTILFSSGTTKALTLTNGSTSVSWSGGVTATAAATVHQTFVTVTFAADGVHRVGVEREANATLDGVAKPATRRVWKPDDLPKALIVGDSYTQGTGSTFNGDCWAKQFALRMGLDAIINGVGGSGYANPGTGTEFGSAARMAYVEAQAYEMVVVAGGINDATGAYAPQVQGNALSYFQAIRARQPNALIVVLGAWPGSTGPSTGTNSVTAVETSIEAAVAALADPMCIYIPVSKSGGGVLPWIFGTGRAGATNGTGNSDLYIGPADATHPGDAGHRYISQRAQQATVAALERSAAN